MRGFKLFSMVAVLLVSACGNEVIAPNGDSASSAGSTTSSSTSTSTASAVDQGGGGASASSTATSTTGNTTSTTSGSGGTGGDSTSSGTGGEGGQDPSCAVDFNQDVIYYANGSVQPGTMGFQAVKLQLAANCKDITVYQIGFYLASTDPSSSLSQDVWCSGDCQAGGDWNFQNFTLVDNNKKTWMGPENAGPNLMTGPNYVAFNDSFVIPAHTMLELTLEFNVPAILPAPDGANKGFIVQFGGTFVGVGEDMGNMVNFTGSSVPEVFFTLTSS